MLLTLRPEEGGHRRTPGKKGEKLRHFYGALVAMHGISSVWCSLYARCEQKCGRCSVLGRCRT
eukprot:564151-Amphidinium_carterae.1